VIPLKEFPEAANRFFLILRFSKITGFPEYYPVPENGGCKTTFAI
jgi:hypothetical protein